MRKETSWLGHAAERARNEPWTLGWILSRYRAAEGIFDDDVAVELGCDTETLRWIHLCRAPSQARFADDVARIADRFSVEPTRLAALIRRADALAALASPGHEASGADLLLAARDREDKEAGK
jgi:hypothetical protein